MRTTIPQVLLKYFAVFILFQIFFTGNLFSQNGTEDFYLKQPDKKIANSTYSVIHFLDSRFDTVNMGTVHFETLSNKVPVVPGLPFNEQFKRLSENLTDTTSKKGELLFQLRKLKFAEKEESGDLTGLCFFRATLFSKNSSGFKKIAAIDTVIIIHYTEISKSLTESAGAVMTNFVWKNLSVHDSDKTNISYMDVLHIDSVEKRNLKAYNGAFKNGIYLNYNSFKNQTPDHKIAELVLKPGGGVKVKIENAKGKKEKIEAEDFYAFVYEEKPYIAAEYGCYLLEKTNDDLFFIGKGTVPGSEQKKDFKIRIDHIDGSFMRVMEVR